MKVNENVAGTLSHLPVLKWAHTEVQRHGWGGSVLEFGAGRYSTAFLYDLERHGFPTLSIEPNGEWLKHLQPRFPEHRFEHSWDGDWWDVVLIDNDDGPASANTWINERAVILKAVKGHCAIALVHDWHIGIGHRDDIVTSFEHYGWFAPENGEMHTAICSDRVPIAGVTIPGGYVYTGWDDAPGDWRWDGWPN